MYRTSSAGWLVAVALLAAVVIVQAGGPGETGGVADRVDLCPADIDDSGTVDVVDFLALLAAWGACCEPSGQWTNDETISYTCAFDLVDFDISVWTLVIESDTLTVLGGPVPMTGLPVGCQAGNQFTVSGTAPGTCVETYTLTATFTDANTFEGTFEADYAGSCVDCVYHSWNVTAARN